MLADSPILSSARAATRALLDLLMPPACIACKAPVATPLSFCGDCYAALIAIDGARCAQCAIPLPLQWQAESLCLGCQTEPPKFDRTAAPYLYEGPARQLILAFKNGREAYAAPMAAAMLRAAPGWVGSRTLVCAVPLHRWRLAARGYNQALLLARAVARRCDAVLEPDLLRRVKATPSMRGLGRGRRRRNVEGAFRLAPDAGARLAGRDVVLVDDVMTTGATASAAAGLLKRGGAARVSVLVVARVAAARPASYVGHTSSQDDHGQG